MMGIRSSEVRVADHLEPFGNVNLFRTGCTVMIDVRSVVRPGGIDYRRVASVVPDGIAIGRHWSGMRRLGGLHQTLLPQWPI
jgi:hypothetical protein